MKVYSVAKELLYGALQFTKEKQISDNRPCQKHPMFINCWLLLLPPGDMNCFCSITDCSTFF